MRDPFFSAGPNISIHPDDRIIETDPRSSPNGHTIDNRYINNRRWRWWFGSMLFVALIIFGRLIDLQIVRGTGYRDSAETNRRRIQMIPAPRGSILDRHGLVLAENVPNFVLAIIPADFPNKPEEKVLVWEALAKATDLPVEQLSDRLNQYTGRLTDPVPIVEQLTADQALPLMIEIADLPGVSVISLPARKYLLGQAAGHILGYIGAVSPEEIKSNPELPLNTKTGKAGLEQVYNTYLTGQDGRREIERDVFNQRHEVLHEQTPITGQTVILGLDSQLQQHLADRLQEAVRVNRATGGAALAIDPRDGSILALVSNPSYDPNWFVNPGFQPEILASLNDPRHPLLNRAIAGQYPSGSIIKPLIGVAGLNEGLISPSTTVNSTGGVEIGRDRFPDWKAGGHGVTNLAKAISESVNTYFYILGGGYEERTGLGVDRIVDYLERFGWGDPVGLDLPGEAGGLLPTKIWRSAVRLSPWRLGDTYHLAIGQGDLQVTPLQVVTAIASIANGGTIFQPHLLKEIRNPDGSLESTQPIERHSLGISPGAIQAVQAGMRQGVLTGSSQSLQSLTVTSAGKTGTAEFGSAGKTHAWFAGFAPYEQPTIAITVIIEGGGEGHAAALPVAKDVLDWYFKNPNQ